jgi:hypothetical protein
MIISEQTDKNMFHFVDFLKEKNLTIPDKDVAPVYKMRYGNKLNVAELSTMLSLLESQGLLNKEKSVNKKDNFYTEKHKLFIDYANGKL